MMAIRIAFVGVVIIYREYSTACGGNGAGLEPLSLTYSLAPSPHGPGGREGRPEEDDEELLALGPSRRATKEVVMTHGGRLERETVRRS